MLYWLSVFSDQINVLNLFRYLTVRTGGAMFTAGVFVFLFGPWIIDHLRLRQGKGQPIREDGPQSHLAKRGTPTMGGLMILTSLVLSMRAMVVQLAVVVVAHAALLVVDHMFELGQPLQQVTGEIDPLADRPAVNVHRASPPPWTARGRGPVPALIGLVRQPTHPTAEPMNSF